MAVRLGDTAPDFTAETTEGTINFHDWLASSSKSRNARRSCSAQWLSTALRRSGRVMLTIVTGPSCSIDTVSVR